MTRDIDNNRKWLASNIRRYSLTLNRTHDKDVLDHLERQPNKRAYLIKLIRDDIDRGDN